MLAGLYQTDDQQKVGEPADVANDDNASCIRRSRARIERPAFLILPHHIGRKQGPVLLVHHTGAGGLPPDICASVMSTREKWPQEASMLIISGRNSFKFSIMSHSG